MPAIYCRKGPCYFLGEHRATNIVILVLSHSSAWDFEPRNILATSSRLPTGFDERIAAFIEHSTAHPAMYTASIKRGGLADRRHCASFRRSLAARRYFLTISPEFKAPRLAIELIAYSFASMASFITLASSACSAVVTIPSSQIRSSVSAIVDIG